jgi:hypothetical protein
MIYTVYLDESGTHQGAKSLIVAGYLALEEEWTAFELEWRAALSDYQVAAFHATDFANQVAPFDGWSSKKRLEFFESLTSIIARHAWAGYAVFIPIDRYTKAVSERAAKMLGGPYGLAALRLFFDVADTLRAVDPMAEIAYVLEDGARGKGQILKVYELKQQYDNLRIRSLRFGTKDHFVPLQAADVLAYELYREHTRQIDGNVWPSRWSYLRPLGRLPCIGGVISEAETASWSRIAEAAEIHNPDLSPKVARQLNRRYGQP